MSMLAEPKRKTKWTLNPRGQAWAKDENKIGQKLLEKMGWQKGKGLGKSENGRTDNIKVNYKNDNNGIGFDDKSNSWITHQDDFNTILANLNKNYNDDNENVSLQNNDVEQPASQSNTKVSLEQRSRSFKSRVHYQKFVRGKDVSRYTKKDMESIFGMKLSDEKSNADNRKSETEQPRTEETKNDNFQNGNDSTENDALHNNFNGVPLFKSSSSMSDYFAEKMKKLKQQKFNLGNNCVEQEDISVSSENDLVAFSTGEKDLVAISTSENDLVASSTVENDVSSNENDYRKKKKESKKRKAVLLEEPTFDETTSSDSSGPVIKKRKGNSKTLGGVHIAVSPLKKNRIANCNFDQATKSLRSCFRVNLTDNVTKLMKRVTFNEIPTIFDEKSAGDSDYQNCSDKDISEGNSYNPKDAPNSNDTGNVKNLETEPYEDECELNNKHTIEDECELNNKHTIENECELNNKHTIEDECELNNKHTIYDDDKQVLQSHTEQISDSCSFCSKKCSDSSISQKNGQPVGNDESWAVSQRLAMKMSYYKLMLKNIKKHEILSKTNILDIKGYGNW